MIGRSSPFQTASPWREGLFPTDHQVFFTDPTMYESDLMRGHEQKVVVITTLHEDNVWRLG